MSIHNESTSRPWPTWKRALFYALYALAAAGAIELVDAKVHAPAQQLPNAAQR